MNPETYINILLEDIKKHESNSIAIDFINGKFSDKILSQNFIPKDIENTINQCNAEYKHLNIPAKIIFVSKTEIIHVNLSKKTIKDLSPGLLFIHTPELSQRYLSLLMFFI
jgi:hypothetical protein